MKLLRVDFQNSNWKIRVPSGPLGPHAESGYQFRAWPSGRGCQGPNKAPSQQL